MQQQEWAPEFAKGLSNHLPMAVHALQSMNGTQAQVKRLTAHLIVNLEPITPANEVLLSWEQVISLKGKRCNYEALRSYFLEHLNTQTTPLKSANIQLFLAELLPGLSCGAFHPLIRLAHALSCNNTREIASALAYWVYAYQELAWPTSTVRCQSSLAITIDTLLSHHQWPTHRLGKNLVSDDIDCVREQNAFNYLIFKPEYDQIKLVEMEEAILNLYLDTNDFTILHGVTATYAVRVISEAYELENVLVYLWQGLITAFLSKGIDEKKISNTKKELLWVKRLSIDEIMARACHSLDAHTIKLVAVCLKMHQLTNNSHYLLAASRKIQQDSSTVIL